MRPGRLVRVRDGAVDWGWGVLVNYRRTLTAPAMGAHTSQNASAGVLLPAKDDADATTEHYVLDCLLACDPSSAESEAPLTFFHPFHPAEACASCIGRMRMLCVVCACWPVIPAVQRVWPPFLNSSLGVEACCSQCWSELPMALNVDMLMAPGESFLSVASALHLSLLV